MHKTPEQKIVLPLMASLAMADAYLQRCCYAIATGATAWWSNALSPKHVIEALQGLVRSTGLTMANGVDINAVINGVGEPSRLAMAGYAHGVFALGTIRASLFSYWSAAVEHRAGAACS